MKFFVNMICNKKVKYVFLISLLFFIYVLVCAISYVDAVSNGLSDSVFRLHVIANSDSSEDQSLKLVVRDKILEYMNVICSNISSKDEAMEIVSSHLDDFRDVAVSCVRELGYDYDVNVEIGNFDFPTKSYGDVSFPSGFYDALRVKIGSASGKNWWCVMFPPLCFVDVSSGVVPDSSKENMKDNLSTEEYGLIYAESDDLSFKFKLVEFFQNIKILTAHK